MSGGSYDYAYSRIEEMAARLLRDKDPLRRAFAEHLRKAAKAMHDVEWVDSCDYGRGDEHEAIMACITKQELADSAISTLSEAVEQAQKVLIELKVRR